MDSFSFGVVLWEIITKERSQRGNWRPVRVPEECPAEVEALLRVCSGPTCSCSSPLSLVVDTSTAFSGPRLHHPHVLASEERNTLQQLPWPMLFVSTLFAELCGTITLCVPSISLAQMT